jgi:hypothetical protein
LHIYQNWVKISQRACADALIFALIMNDHTDTNTKVLKKWVLEKNETILQNWEVIKKILHSNYAPVSILFNGKYISDIGNIGDEKSITSELLNIIQ